MEKSGPSPLSLPKDASWSVVCRVHTSADQRAALQLRGGRCISISRQPELCFECHSVYCVEGGGKKISHRVITVVNPTTREKLVGEMCKIGNVFDKII